MLGLNKIMLIGTVGRTPETRYIAQGVSFTRLSVATTERVSGPGGRLIDETEWHEVVIFRELSEYAAQYVKRGDTVYVEGRLKSRYINDTPESGHRIYEVLASNLIIIQRSKANQESPLPDVSISADGKNNTTGISADTQKIGAGLPGFDIENISADMKSYGDSLPF